MRPLLSSACLAVGLLAGLPPASALAQSRSFEVGGGVSLTRDNEDTPVAAASWLPEWRAFRGGILHWEVGAMHIRGRNHSSYDNGDDVSVLHGGLRYERPSGFTGGFGVGVQSGETEALSGGPQFVSTIGWRWGRFSLLGRHISNASLHQPNDGETMLLGAWRF